MRVLKFETPVFLMDEGSVGTDGVDPGVIDTFV